MALRKDQVDLTAAEKIRFINAVLALKAEIKPGNTLSTYDVFVKIHDDAMAADTAHRGPAFLAWHREYLRRFELELQRISAQFNPWSPGRRPMLGGFDARIMGGAVLGLPYWDWSTSNIPPAWPFTTEFLGGNGTSDPRFPGKVMDGPFAYDGPNHWTLNVFPHDVPPSEHYRDLRRQFGADPDPQVRSLPSMEDVGATLAATPFDSAPWDATSQSGFRNRLEGRIPQAKPDEYIPKMHNRVHYYVGGTMGPSTSPNDPVFWLHHCYIDKLWADWQRLHPNEPGYLPDGGARTSHNLRDVMAPWNEKAPKDVLNIRELGYHYDTDNYLMANDELHPGQGIRSANGEYTFYYDDRHNNLALVRSGYSDQRWISTEHPLPDGWCRMQDDGNLVMCGWRWHTSAPPVLYASNTAYNRGGYVQVENDGHLRMYQGSDGKPVPAPRDWSVPMPSVGNPARV
jgi:tyrosinase